MVLAAVVSSAQQTSRWLESSNPRLARAFNPISSQAVVDDIRARVRGNEAVPGSIADAGLSFSPVDARLYSLQGEVALRAGDKEEAARFFTRALGVSKTEPLALRRMFALAAERQDYRSAVSFLDIWLRRWPERYEGIAPVMPAILSQPSGYAAVLDLLHSGVPWSGRLLSNLSKVPETGPLAYRLVSDLDAAGRRLPAAENRTVLVNLVAAKWFELGYRLFIRSLDESERPLAGYVFDGDFTRASTRRPFEWLAHSVPGIQLSLGPAEGKPSGARIRFLSKPIKQVGLQQWTFMPPGRYTLAIRSSGSGLKLPKGLFWSLRCNGAQELARIPVEESSYRDVEATAEFTIEQQTCPLQNLKLQSGLTTDSWKFRYEGLLEISSVSIRKLAS